MNKQSIKSLKDNFPDVLDFMPNTFPNCTCGHEEKDHYLRNNQGEIVVCKHTSKFKNPCLCKEYKAKR